MSCILDIDLDYFRLFKDPVRRFDEILEWAERPVDFVVDQHHRVVKHWSTAIKRGVIETPTFIVHADEHHDMLSEHPPMQFGNYLYFVLRKWSDCHVYWLTKDPIDHPAMWLSEDAWESVRARFRYGSRLHPKWPKPQLVSVCTSPGFIEESLLRRLVDRIPEVGRLTKTTK